jgi:hypothetical protein
MKISIKKPERGQIDPTDEVLVRHWAKKLGKTPDEIVAAIRKVGNNAESIRRELGCDDKEDKDVIAIND